MQKPDLLAFDLDGTLIDSIQDIAWSINAMRNSFWLPELSTETVRSYIGDGARMLVERALGEAPVDPVEAYKRYQGCYAGHLTVYTKLYPGVAEGLKELHDNGVKLAVVTNKTGDAAREILRKLAALDFFDGVIGGDAGVALKPAPDSLLEFKERFNAGECWMFGDHYTDLEAGRRAGFFRVFAEYGFGEMRGEGADLIVDTFSEMVDAALRGRVEKEEI